MVKIPSLYELACWAHSGTWMPGYQEAFDKAMLEGEKPCLILMRIASIVPEIPFGDKKIKNVFSWHIACMNKELFGMFEPLQDITPSTHAPCSANAHEIFPEMQELMDEQLPGNGEIVDDEEYTIKFTCQFHPCQGAC